MPETRMPVLAIADSQMANNALEILCEVRNHIAFITLNRPAALNALSFGMITGLREALGEYACAPEVRAVVIRGAGERAFCAGGDIRALYESFKSAGSLHHEFFIEEYRLDYFLHHYPKPYVAILDGITMGGGMGLAQGSNLRIVGDRTRIAMPEVGIGLFPDVGASYFLSHLPGALGIYLALTGSQIRAAEVLYAGLADVYLPSAAIKGVDAAFDTLIWSDDARADLSRAIQLLAATHLPVTQPTGLPVPSLKAMRAAIDTHFSPATVPGILNSLGGETRAEYSEWAQQTLKLMSGRSPTMLRVTLRQLQLGRHMSLADCFRMELGMTRQCFIQGDFLEGVRALIIDKDNAPHWSPARLEDVTDAAVSAFFESPWVGAAHPLRDL